MRIARYPEGHELEGKDIERTSTCSRCGEPFTQSRLDGESLNALAKDAPDHLDLLLKTCERAPDPETGKSQVWTPARCNTCTRALLNSSNPSGPTAQAGTSHVKILP